MSWVSVSMVLDDARADTLADALLEHGAVSTEVTDADADTEHETGRYDEPGEALDVPWRRVRVSALFEAIADHQAAIREACRGIGLAIPVNIETRIVADQDWVAATQRQFGPIRVSDRLWVIPSWAELPTVDAITLRLDPGLAFGTGAHPTTWQCLRWLDEHFAPSWSVLDYGCGSGILAIAAKKLAAGRVLGVDIDANAVEVSKINAARNDVTIEFSSPDAVGDQMFDVVLANILANPLRVLAPLLAPRAGKHIVLAGVLERQARDVLEAYAPWVALETAYRNDGWICLTGVQNR
jgi:ribosomal protein L11 methyltransferase